MKKVLLSILLMLLPFLASAEPVEIDGIWYNLVSKAQEAEVTRNPNGLNNYSGNIVIPASVTYNEIEYSVTSIVGGAFYNCEHLSSITIPNSITSIYATFNYCDDLTAVYITDLEAWCNIQFGKSEPERSNPLCYAHHLFLNGEEIKELIIPNSVTSIGYRTFSGCSSFSSVTIPNSVTSIGDEAFQNCSGLTSITIPNSVASIGNYAFNGCSGLTSVSIPNSVTSIGNYAFSGCSGLTSVTIPNSVTSIGNDAFSYCSGLTSVTIPNSVTSIGYQAFYYCSGLTSVTIGNSVTSIGNRAFSDCDGLTSITIPNSVTTIGEQAFASCDMLTDVFCLAEKIRNESWGSEGLYTHPDAFKDSYPQAMTLHVPAASIEAYRSTAPWSQFKPIVALEDGDTPTTQKCATPEISYADGKLDFTCETEGVEFVSEVIVGDAKKYYDASVTLSQTYKVTVYATKAGYENSDVATREIIIENGQSSLFGDLNKDGKVNVADHVKLSDIIMNNK